MEKDSGVNLTTQHCNQLSGLPNYWLGKAKTDMTGSWVLRRASMGGGALGEHCSSPVWLAGDDRFIPGIWTTPIKIGEKDAHSKAQLTRQKGLLEVNWQHSQLGKCSLSTNKINISFPWLQEGLPHFSARQAQIVLAGFGEDPVFSKSTPQQ